MHIRLRTAAALAVCLYLASIGSAKSAGQDNTSPEAIVTTAVAVVQTKNTSSLQQYFFLYCSSKEQASLSKDSDVGALARHKERVKSDLAVIAVPAGGAAATTYCVYFSGGKPIGIATIETADLKSLKDETVAAAYTAISGPAAAKKQPVIQKVDDISADDGSPISTFQVIGWK